MPSYSRLEINGSTFLRCSSVRLRSPPKDRITSDKRHARIDEKYEAYFMRYVKPSQPDDDVAASSRIWFHLSSVNASCVFGNPVIR